MKAFPKFRRFYSLEGRVAFLQTFVRYAVSKMLRFVLNEPFLRHAFSRIRQLQRSCFCSASHQRHERSCDWHEALEGPVETLKRQALLTAFIVVTWFLLGSVEDFCFCRTIKDADCSILFLLRVPWVLYFGAGWCNAIQYPYHFFWFSVYYASASRSDPPIVKTRSRCAVKKIEHISQLSF